MSKSSQAVLAPTIKSVIFVIATLLVLLLVAIELGAGFAVSRGTRYEAVFSDTSGLQSGDSVRVAGVKVGTVEDVTVEDQDRVRVAFDVSEGRPVPQNALLAVRYLNLTGDRFLEVSRGEAGAAEPLPADGEIPVQQTRGALDLDVLLAGFHPLFEGLSPDEINGLAGNVVAVFQGQGGNLESLLSRIASLTSTLADRDAVIGRTVDSLNLVLDSLDRRSPELETTISRLQQLTSGLAGDRERIGQSLEGTTRLVGGIETLLGKVRGPLTGTVDELKRATAQANAGADTIDESLRMLPGAYLRIARVGSRGATYNLFVCSLRAKVTGPDGNPRFTPWIGPADNVERCNYDANPLETPEEREAKEAAEAENPGDQQAQGGGR
ncbi:MULTISPECIES: MCE family protein [unclassified Pseudonocardia]|uniref:MCE family protein n=1 Tax=unclassified Pseudonocardia TaxID=2619320 RepID=UPI0001FFE4A9|nr:MCE family protein [Pseudonocardia sp. Ae707_Ps1]OLM16749.1 MCE-family protein Mce1B [Pseudonocardia sp. Ae707_Ps1]